MTSSVAFYAIRNIGASLQIHLSEFRDFYSKFEVFVHLNQGTILLDF